MLTGELIAAKVSGTTVQPRFVAPDDPKLIGEADALRAIFAVAAEERWTHGAVDEALAEALGDDPRHKLPRGLAKVLLDACTFETRCPAAPAALRLAAFTAAAAGGPLLLRPGPAGGRTAADVLAALAADLPPVEDPEGGPAQPWSPAALSAALYADHKDEQRLVEAKLPADGTALLHRYNVALVQACLLRARGLRLRLEAPAPGRVRQLLRALKFWQLLFTLHDEDGALVVEVDGPQSLLSATTRYGLQLAQFFPALLLQPGPWTLDAELAWGKAGHRKRLRLDEEAGLRSHYADDGAWEPRAVAHLRARWAELDTGWELIPGAPLALGGQRVLVPDLGFRKQGREAWLDVLGYWKKKQLKDRLDIAPQHVILAVSKRLCGDETAAAEASGRVVPFAELINAKAVLERIEQHARPIP